MKKVLSLILCAAILLGIAPLSALPVSAEEVLTTESTTVNVYDATTLGEMLKTENVDIVLWQDINYTGEVKVKCNSIDLNGYNLTCSSMFQLNSSNEDRTVAVKILDSRFQSSDSGSAKFLDGIFISNSTLIIESGNISISRKDIKTKAGEIASSRVYAGIYGTGEPEEGNLQIVKYNNSDYLKKARKYGQITG